MIACDLVVGASNDALQTIKHGRTRVVANLHEIQTAKFVLDPEADLHVEALLEKIRYAAGAAQLSTCDAQALSVRMLGDTIGANILLLGFAWQQGLVPVSLEALGRAIELNGVAVATNLTAFSLGRLAAGDPQGLAALAGTMPDSAEQPDEGQGESLAALVDARVAMLTAYQSAAYATQYRALVDEVERAERKLVGELGVLRLSPVVARVHARLLAIKDEYEVARLFTDGQFDASLNEQFEGDFSLQFHMAPPLLSRPGPSGRPRKLTFGPRLMPLLRLLARAKVVRGTVLDIFGRSEERRMERELAADYARTIRALLPRLTSVNMSQAIELAGLADGIRGFGPVKLANLRRIKQQERTLVHELGLDFVAGPTVSHLCEPFRGRAALQAISVVKAP